MERALAVDSGLPRVAEGVESHPVLDVIHERLQSASRPGERKDGARVALAIEGGGMRGVVSAGMVAALEDLGTLDAFDDIYGASAGAFNGAYLISRRARLGTTIYYEDVNNRHFIDLRRALRGEPILNLDFMLDVVAESIKPIDWQAVITSPIRLHPIAFSLAEQRAVEIEYATKADLKRALKASSSIPWVAGEPVKVEGQFTWWDASFSESIPFRTAYSSGATHVLALMTRPSGVLRGRPNLVERHFITRKIAKYGRDLVPLYLKRPESYAADIAFIKQKTDSPVNDGKFLYGVTLPVGTPKLSQLETGRSNLIAGAVAGFKTIYRVFGRGEPAARHELRGFFF